MIIEDGVKMKVKVLKRNPLAVLPFKAHDDDAGWDLTYCSKTPGEETYIAPGESKLFDTGLSFFIPKQYCILVRNRSGVASKKGLLVGAELVDAGYTGTVFVNLHNVGQATRTVNHGDKIAQFLILPVPEAQMEEVNEEVYDFLHSNSKRKDGALGSTDNKKA